MGVDSGLVLAGQGRSTHDGRLVGPRPLPPFPTEGYSPKVTLWKSNTRKLRPQLRRKGGKNWEDGRGRSGLLESRGVPTGLHRRELSAESSDPDWEERSERPATESKGSTRSSNPSRPGRPPRGRRDPGSHPCSRRTRRSERNLDRGVHVSYERTLSHGGFKSRSLGVYTGINVYASNVLLNVILLQSDLGPPEPGHWSQDHSPPYSVPNRYTCLRL